MPKASPPPEPWDGQPRQAADAARARRKRAVENTKIIDSNALVNNVGTLRLSGEGAKQLKLMRKFYGGETVSYTVDRLLRRAVLSRVVYSLVMDANDYGMWEKEALARGFPDAESFIEATIDKATDKLKKGMV